VLLRRRGLETGEPLAELLQLLIDRRQAIAQVQDLRQQEADCGADDESGRARLHCGAEYAEQDRQTPARPF
jgi:hypothetical protein